MNPLVSIIIPAYNHEQYVESAVVSVLSQTYNNIEIILLNDGSTDLTGQICQEIKTNYPQIKYFSHDNIGAHNTINKGIDAASGTYISILNSDDIFFPNKIQRCIEIINKKSSIQLICGKVKFIDDFGNIQKKGISVDWQKRGLKYFKETNLLPLSILNENFIATTSNMFFTKAIWDKVGGFQALRYCHDLDFLMAAFRSGEYVYDSENHYIMYRVHQNNTIKENLKSINFEIASVIACSLMEDNIKLLPNIDNNSIKQFFYFLSNKKNSDLIIYLMIYYLKFNNRNEYYENLNTDKSIILKNIENDKKILF